MKKWWALLIVFVIIVVGALALAFVPAPPKAPVTGTTATSTNPLADIIVVDAPIDGAAVTSPLTMSGKARGNWYFEASAPVALLDSNGAVIAQGFITANGDWMTADFVPFTGSLTFPDQPAGSTGTLVLSNDNPSGDPTRQKTLDIPVTF